MITTFLELCEKDVINCNNGALLGCVSDIEIKIDECKVTAIIVSSKKGLICKNEEIRIPWDKIEKIGVDVIIVNYCQVSVSENCCEKPKKRFGFK